MKKNTPDICVIISCFNYENFVGRAIESVLSQNCDQCELLVVDDGSSDGSWGVIQRYDLDGAFRVSNGGAVKACSYGVARSRAPFVLFLDADDELAPGSLARIVSRLDPNVAKLQFALTPIDEGGAVLGPPAPRLSDFRGRDALMREVRQTGSYMSPPTSGNVFRRDLCALLAEVDYDPWVDGVILFVAPFLGDVVSIAEPLGFYRLHGRNVSQSGMRATAARFRQEADRFVDRHDHLARLLSRHPHDARLPDARTVFFYRERRLYEKILNGGRPTFREVLPMVRLLATSPRPFRDRAALMMFLLLSLGLPSRLIHDLLDYRLQVGRRSAFGVLRRLLAAPG